MPDGLWYLERPLGCSYSWCERENVQCIAVCGWRMDGWCQRGKMNFCIMAQVAPSCTVVTFSLMWGSLTHSGFAVAHYGLFPLQLLYKSICQSSLGWLVHFLASNAIPQVVLPSCLLEVMFIILMYYFAVIRMPRMTLNEYTRWFRCESCACLWCAFCCTQCCTVLGSTRSACGWLTWLLLSDTSFTRWVKELQAAWLCGLTVGKASIWRRRRHMFLSIRSFFISSQSLQ